MARNKPFPEADNEKKSLPDASLKQSDIPVLTSNIQPLPQAGNPENTVMIDNR